ncbi:MAG: aldo/keto reductase [Rhodoglobus sp.]|nr:aldo/keto reductase [Rhodoglobus sp.]
MITPTLRPDRSGPRVALGCGSMSDVESDAAFAVLDAFREVGGRILDTARIYGTSETVVGAWLDSRDARQHMVVVTKGGHPAPDWTSRLSRDAVVADALASLDALRIPAVDCYLLHRDDVAHPIDDIASTLAEIVALGYAKRIGVSNWDEARVRELGQALRSLGGPALAVVSNYGGVAVPTAPAEWPGVRSTTPELLRLAHDEGFEVLGWSSLSSGFFTKSGGLPEFAGPENQRRRALLHSIAADADVMPAAVLVRALATLDPAFIPVFATRSPDRARQLCIDAQEERLDESVERFTIAVRAVDQIIPKW